MKDLESHDDIQLLVDRFYHKIQNTESLGYIFNDVAKVNWEKHLPKMYDFWESILFGSATYKGNPMAVHFPINQMVALEKSLFEQWLFHWKQTVDENFVGDNANAAKTKADNIANLMAYKMEIARRLDDH